MQVDIFMYILVHIRMRDYHHLYTQTIDGYYGFQPFDVSIFHVANNGIELKYIGVLSRLWARLVGPRFVTTPVSAPAFCRRLRCGHDPIGPFVTTPVFACRRLRWLGTTIGPPRGSDSLSRSIYVNATTLLSRNPSVTTPTVCRPLKEPVTTSLCVNMITIRWVGRVATLPRHRAQCDCIV
jgi:hypothetical protein